MKRFIFLLTLFAAFSQSQAQQFTTTKAYYGAFQSTLDETHTEQPSLLIYNKQFNSEVTTIPIAQAAVISNLAIEQLEVTGLDGVSQVLKITITYEDYCTFTASSYVLETHKGGYISLPMLTNEDCGDLQSTLTYIFPSQAFGKPNEIITAQAIIKDNAILAITQEDTFIWKDDNYGTAARLYDNF